MDEMTQYNVANITRDVIHQQAPEELMETLVTVEMSKKSAENYPSCKS